MATKRNVTTYLSRDEIRSLVTPTNLEGVLSVATSWSVIAACFVLLARFPTNPLAWIVAVVVLGGRQLALAILMHECSHHSLFRTRALNDVLGKWLCAAPVWQRLDAYRKHHLAHHAHTSLPGDPDLGLVEPYPTTRRSLARKLARDLSGIAFFRRVAGQLAMDAHVLTYSASTGQQRVSPPPSAGKMLANLATNFGPVVLTNLALAAVLAAFGHGELYAAWVLANATTFSLFVRLRSIAEHAVTENTTDPFRNTRTTRANLLARLTVAPHHVNFHLEHHLVPTVPHYRLPAFHRLLVERGAYADARLAGGYFDVLRLAVKGVGREIA
ncbi:MAG: fatty acid desaturase family protein [Polyangiaceae bacterium]|nr:fatty acid desaturase family protein [Polyangiaceae bacterium]